MVLTRSSEVHYFMFPSSNNTHPRNNTDTLNTNGTFVKPTIYADMSSIHGGPKLDDS